MKRKDNQLLVFTHLSQLLDFVTGFGGFIVPLILWLVNREDVHAMDQHGKAIMNFQISIFIYALICIPLIFLFGIGIIGLILVGVVSLVFPIVNAVRASNGQAPNYPFSIPIFS